jgi:ACR3 family arsenite transporter
MMGREPAAKIGFFAKYLSLWVALCIVAGVAIGHFLPGVPAFLGASSTPGFPSPWPS